MPKSIGEWLIYVGLWAALIIFVLLVIVPILAEFGRR